VDAELSIVFVDKDEINKRLLLRERSTFARNQLNETVVALQKHYREEGYYFAHIIFYCDNIIECLKELSYQLS